MTNAFKMDLKPRKIDHSSETVWIFDLDNTLYSASSDVFADIDGRMGQFIAGHFSVSLEEAHRMRYDFFMSHGTTLRGLMDEHGMAPGKFLDYVHDIDIGRIGADAGLIEAVSGLQGQKYIFTNATVRHAVRILDRLDLAGYFDGIFDIEAADYIPKPNQKPYEDMLGRYGIQPESAVMVEDMARNLEPAHGLGMTTVWLNTGSEWGAKGREDHFIHHEIDNLADWLAQIIQKDTRDNSHDL